MKYCRKCKKSHRGDKSMFQIKQPHDKEALVDFIVHLARKHDLVDLKLFPGETPVSPDVLIRVLNTKDKLSRKQKKAHKKLQASYDALDF